LIQTQQQAVAHARSSNLSRHQQPRYHQRRLTAITMPNNEIVDIIKLSAIQFLKKRSKTGRVDAWKTTVFTLLSHHLY
jgi:hypothetical protein